MNKKNIIDLYNLPSKVKFCKKCTISNQRPRTTFDENGICSACNYTDYKRNVNWKMRNKELEDLCNRFRSKNGNFDVLVPCSGGKDSSYVAHQLKYKYNMNPLCVTWAPLRHTEIGRRNLDNFIKSGFDHILGTPNPEVTRILTEQSFKEIGDPFQPFILGQMNFPLTTAIKYKIPLIMYGENGEAEYGGDASKADKPTRDIDDFDKFYFSKKPAKDWVSKKVSLKDISHFLGPDISEIKKNNTEIHFFGYYNYWDPQENFYYCLQNTNFSINPERTEGTYSKYASLDDRFDSFHYYLAYIKFGLGRTTSDSAHEIRDNKINRDEGVALVKKFDGEFPKKYYQEFLNYCSISENKFEEIIDSWRAEHIWTKSNDDKFILRNPIWKENEH